MAVECPCIRRTQRRRRHAATRGDIELADRSVGFSVEVNEHARNGGVHTRRGVSDSEISLAMSRDFAVVLSELTVLLSPPQPS